MHMTNVTCATDAVSAHGHGPTMQMGKEPSAGHHGGKQPYLGVLLHKQGPGPVEKLGTDCSCYLNLVLHGRLVALVTEGAQGPKVLL